MIFILIYRIHYIHMNIFDVMAALLWNNGQKLSESLGPAKKEKKVESKPEVKAEPVAPVETPKKDKTDASKKKKTTSKKEVAPASP